MRTRMTIITALVTVMVVGTVGSALAATDADLETVRSQTLESMANTIERFEQRIERLDGRDGVGATQARGLAADGIAIYTAAISGVESATTVGEIAEIRSDARREYRAHKRVRNLYTHIQRDITKFERRLDRLERAISRATEAEWDTTEAQEYADDAADDLAAAQTLLDAIDPGDTGTEVKVLLDEAHEAAHDGARNVRHGFHALRAARGADAV